MIPPTDEPKEMMENASGLRLATINKLISMWKRNVKYAYTSGKPLRCTECIYSQQQPNTKIWWVTNLWVTVSWLTPRSTPWHSTNCQYSLHSAIKKFATVIAEHAEMSDILKYPRSKSRPASRPWFIRWTNKSARYRTCLRAYREENKRILIICVVNNEMYEESTTHPYLQRANPSTVGVLH